MSLKLHIQVIQEMQLPPPDIPFNRSFQTGPETWETSGVVS